MIIKTFRGLVADNTQDTIVLHTNDGSMGYRIVKFEIYPKDWEKDEMYNCAVYKVSQTAITTEVDFSNQTLLAAAYIETVAFATSRAGQNGAAVLFDNEIFNQDIFVTMKSINGEPINYYIELEQVKLDLSENTVATLKDIRNVTAPT
jgi:hypothetical protein